MQSDYVIRWVLYLISTNLLDGKPKQTFTRMEELYLAALYALNEDIDNFVETMRSMHI